MTTGTEKTFFDTFGIEPKTIIEPRYSLNTEYYEEKIEKYPQITDRILLELICIVLNTFQTFEVCRIMDIDSLKEKILKLSMLAKDEVYSEVHALFEEEN